MAVGQLQIGPPSFFSPPRPKRPEYFFFEKPPWCRRLVSFLCAQPRPPLHLRFFLYGALAYCWCFFPLWRSPFSFLCRHLPKFFPSAAWDFPRHGNVVFTIWESCASPGVDSIRGFSSLVGLLFPHPPLAVLIPFLTVTFVP